jgi:hypothetical protein
MTKKNAQKIFMAVTLWLYNCPTYNRLNLIRADDHRRLQYLR